MLFSLTIPLHLLENVLPLPHETAIEDHNNIGMHCPRRNFRISGILALQPLRHPKAGDGDGCQRGYAHQRLQRAGDENCQTVKRQEVETR